MKNERRTDPVLDGRCVELIKALCEAKAPSGFEDEVHPIAREYAKDFADCERDSTMNLYIYPRTNKGNRPVLMLDAHSDEVGFMIRAIKPNGTLAVVALGGWSMQSVPGTPVFVRTVKGSWIRGMICAKPIHHMSADERKALPAMKDLAIDIGAFDEAEARRMGAAEGEPAVVATAFSVDARGVMFGRAFDCRIGCAALLETMRRIYESGIEPKVDIVGVLSAQEEVGERGAKVAVGRVKPQLALCFEGAPADDTVVDGYMRSTSMGFGPMLRYMDNSLICNPRYMRWTLSLAKKNGIEVQSAVREAGGNNGAVIQVSEGGIPAAVAGIPVRYAHSPSCVCDYFDFEQAVKLGVETVKEIDEEIIKTF